MFGARRNLVLALGCALLCVAVEAADRAPVFVDTERSLSKQEAAANAAAKVAVVGAKNLKPVLKLLDDKSGHVRDRVVKEIVRNWSEADLGALVLGLKVRSPLIHDAICEIWERKGYAGAVKPLAKALPKLRDEEAIVSALRTIAASKSKDAWEAVAKLHKKERKRFRVKGEALRTLSQIDPEKAKSLVKEGLDDKLLPVRIMALFLLAAQDQAGAVKAATQMIDTSAGERDKVWGPRLLFGALDLLVSVSERVAVKAELKLAIEAMIRRLEKAIGREQHELGIALGEITGERELAPEHFAWKGWWEAQKDKWEPKPKAKKKKTKKKGKKGKKDKEPEEKPAPMRPVTSAVRFHGIPIHSLRLTFVQDISGGMKNPVGGRGSDTPAKLTKSKKELAKVLVALDDRAQVNLLYFATNYFKCAPAPVSIKKFRKKLIQFNAKQEIPDAKKKGLGRSNLYDSIAYAISQPNIDTVYVLTEGGPTEGRFIDTKRFVRHIKRLNDFYRVRVHTMLIGSSSSGSTFLAAVAKATGGKFYDLKKIGK